MKSLTGCVIGCLVVVLLLNTSLLMVQGDTGDYLIITGIVKDKENRKRLENVNVSVAGSNIGTATNAEEQFSLKIKNTDSANDLEISHIGY